MLDNLLNLMETIAVHWKVFLLSMIPISELRVSIPLGIFWDMDPLSCFFWAIFGNFVPILPLLIFLPLIYKLLLKLPFGQKTIGTIVNKFRRKGEQTKKYGFWGLTVLVAIPLPGTGVWTGCAVAFLFGWPIAKAVIAITIGEIIAGILVTIASAGVASLGNLIYGLEYIVIAALAVILIYFLWKKRKKSNN